MRTLLVGILISSSLFGFSLNEAIQQLHQGDILVLDFQQSIWVIEVKHEELNQRDLCVSSATSDLIDRLNISSWIWWAQSGYPQANNQEHLTISLSPFHVTPTSPKAQWFSSLIPLTLTEVPQTQRRRQGIAPKGLDTRPIWHPPIVIEGKREQLLSRCYVAQWPEDDSPYAATELYIYIPEPPALAFPYRIETKGRSYSMSVIDSKKGRP